MNGAAWFGAVGGVGAHVLVGPSEEDVRTLDANIEHLNTDIFNTADPPGHALDPQPMAWRKFKVEWVTFHVHWAGWKTEHVDALSRSTTESGAEYESFVTGYNEFLRRFKADFQGTTDAPVETRDDGAIPTDLPWKTILVVGALGLGAYMLLQTGMLARIAQGRKSHA